MPSYITGKPEERVFPVLPAGEYSLECVNGEEQKTQKGDDMIKLTWKVKNPDGTDGPRLFDRLVFLQTSFWKIDQCLAACGRHPGQGKSIFIHGEQFIGMKCRAKVKVVDYKGNDQNEIDSYILPDGF